MNSGTVKFFSKAKKYGFIICDKTKQEIFVHIDQVNHRIELMKGDTVEFNIEKKNGKPQAENVEILFG
jgi:cold shock CspA family protein